MLQFTALTRLRELMLCNAYYTTASQAGLSALAGSLTALDLVECKAAPPPSTLAALTGLARLNVAGLATDAPLAALKAALVQALPVLRRLTHLTLELTGLTPLPTALACAPELRQLCLFNGTRNDPLPPGFALPSGPWPQLQELEVSWPHLLGSAVASLQQMGHLTALTINGPSRMPEPAELSAFWAWAAQHPPLRNLLVFWTRDEDGNEGDEDFQQVHLVNAMLSLQRTRPDLHVATDFP